MSLNKFTDAQLVLLSSGAQHAEGAIQLAPNLKGGAAKKVVGKLLRQGLIEEVPSHGTLPEWRRDDNLGSLTLRITQHGLAAIGVEASAADWTAEASAETHSGGNGLVPKQPSRRVKAASREKSKNESPHRSVKPVPRESKQGRVIGMLQRRQGVTIATIMKATRWQAHSVRGFLTAVVRRKLGLALVSEKTGGERIYRIVAKTAPSKRAKRRTARKAG
jgi:hypothetical protein